MTLDPTAVSGIASLAQEIAAGVDDSDHDDIAARVWSTYLDPLYADGRPVLEPLGEQSLNAVGIEDASLHDPAFETSHAIDSGTINPTTFKNGVVIDVAQAAMGVCPTDLDVHRSRSVVATVHTKDAGRHETGWEEYDPGYGRMTVNVAPRVNAYAERIVHALSLYYAESEHALQHAGDVDDLLVLDGPLYPKQIFNWKARESELRTVTEESQPRAIVQNYVDLVERFVEREVPLIGFVKNPISKFVTKTLADEHRKDDRQVPDPPWVDDTAMFVRLLERHDSDGARHRDDLTFTSWFVSRGGADETLAGDRNPFDVDRALPPERYEVTFFVVYDPRDDLLFKIEAPRAFTDDSDVRERLTSYVLSEVALNRGPPTAVAKADELARISNEERQALKELFERDFDSDVRATYDDVRWDVEDL
jgi:hypothetical protein